MIHHNFFQHHIYYISLGSGPEWILVVVAIIAAYIAWRQLKLQDFAEIFITPYKTASGFWEFQIRNGSSRIIYITKAVEENNAIPPLKVSRDKELSLPPGKHIYYTAPAPNPEECNSTIHLDIEFKDNLGAKYRSHHSAWFQNGVRAMQNLKSEKI